MKKILFVITQSEMGGAQKYLIEIAPVLAENNEVIIAAGQGSDKLFEKVSNLKIQDLKYLKRTPWPWQGLLDIWEIYQLLKKEKPDVLFLCSSSAGFFGSLAAFFYRKFQVPCSKFQVIYRIGGWAFNDPRCFISQWLIILAEKITSPLKDKIIVNSEFDLQTALKYKIAPKEKIIKIYNGINPEELKFLTKEEAIDFLISKIKDQKRTSSSLARAKLQIKNKNLKIVGTIANFYKPKGLKYLIEAIYILSSKFQVLNYKIIIIGDGKERKKLENLIKKYRLENTVFLLGRIPNASKYLKAFDVFVLPSLKEGFPWVVLEAMAGEIPLVATKVGAIPEIINDNENGFLVEPGNSENMAKKIRELIWSPELQKQFALSAKEKLKEFSKEKMLQQTKEIILS